MKTKTMKSTNRKNTGESPNKVPLRMYALREGNKKSSLSERQENPSEQFFIF